MKKPTSRFAFIALSLLLAATFTACNGEENTTAKPSDPVSTTAATTTAAPIAIESISLDKSELSLTVGDSATLVATITPSGATDKSLTWTSSNESVATVDGNGKVTAKTAGSAAIIVTSANGKTATCTVSVKEA